jgi:hypothetical protein
MREDFCTKKETDFIRLNFEKRNLNLGETSAPEPRTLTHGKLFTDMRPGNYIARPLCQLSKPATIPTHGEHNQPTDGSFCT